MNPQLALQINSALVHVYFARHVFGTAPAADALELLSRIKLGQAQTATEVIEAINANTPPRMQGGSVVRDVLFQIDPAGLPALLTEAHLLWAGGAR